MASRERYLLIAGLVLGFVLRLLMLRHVGTMDMGAYWAWGSATLDHGLTNSFHGIYFPIQYQLFEVCAYVASRTQVEWFVSLKMSNLVFDSMNCCLIALIARRTSGWARVTLMYWLNPWFLAVFSLGYIDFQFTFFVLLTVYLLRRGTDWQHYLVAGAPLAVAFLMKPQAQVLVLACGLWVALSFVYRRGRAVIFILVPTVILFAGYSAYFALDPAHGIGFLAGHYLGVASVMPCLNAQQLNPWYIVAHALKVPGGGIYSVTDDAPIFLGLTARHAAMLVTVGCLAGYVMRAFRATKGRPPFLEIFAFSTLLVPFAMTSAHENHLFLGSVLATLLLADPGHRLSRVATHGLLALSAANIYGLYGEKPAVIAEIFRRSYSEELGLAYSWAATACFVCIFVDLVRRLAVGTGEVHAPT